uniref:Mucin family glycoprotein n=1 Tax=Neospora caninum (strain Liverpool) TaxID=572307 RepID=A0A0F7U8J7_NEOCL|nr:TPA: mucin family glycoprotein [Neospora caninum Liverpool]
MTPTISVEDVSSACVAYHNAKRGFQLSPRLSELTIGDKERASRRIQAFIDNGCEDINEVDECRNKGINVFDGTTVSCVDAVRAWYNEVHDYTYERYSNWHFKKTGSFTLLMWHDTEELSCVQTNGCSRIGKPERLLCTYSPSGNTVGEYPFSLDQWKSIIARDGLPQVTIVIGSPSSETPSVTTTSTRTATTTSTRTTTSTIRTTSSTSTTTRTTTTTTTSTTTTTTTTRPPEADFTDECLQIHNNKRAEGMSNPIQKLVRNRGAVSQAEAYRDQMEQRGCPFQHSGVRLYGENLYRSSAHTDCKDAVELWYSEKKNYTSYTALNSFNYQNVGHFTQVMWANSTGLGCAYSSTCRTIVCNYYPPGNYIGQYPFSRAQYNSLVQRDA